MDFKLSKIKKGFTLVETLIVIAIFTVILGAVISSVIIIYRSNSYVWQQAIAVEEARSNIAIIAKELKEARLSDNGSYIIERANDKEIIFYSDIDDDGKTERIRYFMGTVVSSSQVKECHTHWQGGSCNVNFSNFLMGGILKTAELKVSIEGDLDASNEYADVFIDNGNMGALCASGCTHCAGMWQGLMSYNVISSALDNNISITTDGSSRVDAQCSWIDADHSLKSRFEFNTTEEVVGSGNELRKGVIEPIGNPAAYPADQEKITVVTRYLRNSPPLFQYFDANKNEINNTAERLADISLIRIYLVINVDPNRPPKQFELETYIQPRNIKLVD